jgi:thioredoxin 2
MIIRCPSCGHKNRVPPVAAGVPHCGRCGAALPWIAEADDRTYQEVVAGAALPVLLDIWAAWCGPCRMVSPALEHLAELHAGQVKLVKVDADGAPGVSGRFGVQSIPTLLVLRHGREVARQIGAVPEPQLDRWLTRALAAPVTDTDPKAPGT